MSEVDKGRTIRSAFPYKAVVAISFICFVNAYQSCFLFSFVGFMVVDFGNARNNDEAGYFAGYISSAFMLGRTISSIPWGIFADSYGRKPAILIGGISIAIFSFAFGWVESLTAAILIRLFAGISNGIVSTAKTIGSEINNGDHSVYIMSIVVGSWSFGLILGPSLSGILAKPADLYPEVFNGTLFDEKPYLLTSLVPAMLGALSTILCYIWLPETIHEAGHVQYKIISDAKNDPEPGVPRPEDESETPSKKALEVEVGIENSGISARGSFSYFSYDFFIVNALYCSLSFAQIMIDEVIPLWAMSSPEKGGMDMELPEIGALLATGGWFMLIYQFCIYSRIAEKYSLTRTFWISCVAIGVLLIIEPFAVSFQFRNQSVSWQWTLFGLNGIRVAIQSGAFTAISVLSNNAVDKEVRGRANGFVMCIASLFKMLGPSVGGILFAFSINSLYFNFYFTFIISSLLCVAVGIVSKGLLSLQLNEQRG